MENYLGAGVRIAEYGKREIGEAGSREQRSRDQELYND